MKTTEFIIVYDNDTGPYDESYNQWWDIIKLEGDERICQCYSEEMANIIVNALTKSQDVAAYKKELKVKIEIMAEGSLFYHEGILAIESIQNLIDNT